MPEIGTSGLMSGERKRSVAAWPKLPRLSSTLLAHPGYEASNTHSRSRRALRPRLCLNLVPQNRGSKECRVLAAPAVSCARDGVKAHTSIQVQPEHSGIPCAMV